MQLTTSLAALGLLASVATQTGTTPPAPTPVSAPVSFAGTWELKDAGVNAGYYTPFGTWFTATQDSQNLVVEIHILATMDNYPGSPGGMTMERPGGSTTYKLVGETRETEPQTPESAAAEAYQPSDSFPFSLALPVSEVTRSNWSGDELIIVSHTIYRNIGVPKVAPYEDERTERLALSLDTAGRLLVDKLVIEDPFQGTYLQPESVPVNQHIVYNRRR